MAYKLYSVGTVEEKVLQTATQKLGLFFINYFFHFLSNFFISKFLKKKKLLVIFILSFLSSF